MRPATSRTRSILVLVAFLIGMVAPLMPVQVAPVLAQESSCVVTSASDPGPGSLREVIANVGCDLITFNIPVSSPVIVIDTFQTQFVIARNLTIQGPNLYDGSPVIIHGGGATNGSRIFRVTDTVTHALLVRLSLTGGNGVGQSLASPDSGGAILNEGTLKVIESRIYGNTVEKDGGGIENYGGTLSIIRSEISGNIASATGEDYGGGGISIIGGTVTIESTTISGNVARRGGAIEVGPAGSNTTIVNIFSSTILNNDNSVTPRPSTAIEIFPSAQTTVTSTASILLGYTNYLVSHTACNIPLSGSYNLTWGTTFQYLR